jgi:hypothetical protein
MTTVTESDIKELKDLITSQTGQLIAIQKEISDLRVSVGKIETTLQIQQPSIQKIPDLAEKIGELKNWKQIALTLGGALIGGAITYLIKNSSN